MKGKHKDTLKQKSTCSPTAGMKFLLTGLSSTANRWRSNLHEAILLTLNFFQMPLLHKPVCLQEEAPKEPAKQWGKVKQNYFPTELVFFSEITTNLVTESRASECTLGPNFFWPPLLRPPSLASLHRSASEAQTWVPSPSWAIPSAGGGQYCPKLLLAFCLPLLHWGPGHPLLLVCSSLDCWWELSLPGALPCWPYWGAKGQCPFFGEHHPYLCCDHPCLYLVFSQRAALWAVVASLQLQTTERERKETE